MDYSALQMVLPPLIYKGLPKCIKDFNINTVLRLIHFLAQCEHESQGFKRVFENLYYSQAGLLKTFSKYFTPEEAKLYAFKPDAIANRVYGGRMGNGPESSGDGKKFSGRGLLMLTGCLNYCAFDLYVTESILTYPDLVATKFPLESAGFIWEDSGCNALADEDDLTQITRVINGGYNGIADREAKLKKYIAFVKP